ncbi:hypothetical protein [Streptomyces griseorubiginosus]|uniref:hypothetical protein n=1 Tax=Streptomyces griseorubiginosus TaxID=67304 RepID=UPI0036E6162F
MTQSTTTADQGTPGEKGAAPLRGGLPEDASLNAFAIDSDTALAAFPPRKASPRTRVAASRASDSNGAGTPTAAGDSAPAEALRPSAAQSVAPGIDLEPATDPAPVVRVGANRDASPSGNLPTQCTIMVQAQVRERFGRYQTAQKVDTGVEPTNAVVVKRAFLHAHRNDLWAQLREAVRHRQQPVSEEDDDPAGLFGEVPARRVDRGGVKHGVQQSFRPSQQELDVYDAYAEAYRFDNRSDFLDAVLDTFLPPLPSRRPAR